MDEKDTGENIFLDWAFRKGIRAAFGFARIIYIVLSILAQTIFTKLTISIGTIAIMLIHEIGHYLAAKKMNIECSYPVVVPLTGAFVFLKEKIVKYEEEAYFRLAGLIFGTIASNLFGLAYMVTKNKDFLMICIIGIIIHLVNLIPVKPLDGSIIAIDCFNAPQNRKYFGVYSILLFILVFEITAIFQHFDISFQSFR